MKNLILACFLAFSAAVVAGDVENDLGTLRATLEGTAGSHRLEILLQLTKATRINHPEESRGYANEAVELATALQDDQGRTRALVDLGIGHYFLGEYDRALELYFEARELAERIGFRAGLGEALNNIGIISYVRGDYSGAVDYYSRALEILKLLDDRTGMAKCYNNLGSVSYAAGRHEKSIEYFTEAVAIYGSEGAERLVASSLNNLGLAFFRLERMDEALSNVQQASAIQETLGDKPGLAASQTLFGMIHEGAGRDQEALGYYLQAKLLHEELGDRQGITSGLNNIGMIYARARDYDRALLFLGQALAQARELGLLELERDIHSSYADVYELMGRYDKAFQSFTTHKEISDRLRDEETGRQLAEMETRFKVEQKDREITTLLDRQQQQRLIRNGVIVFAVLLMALIVLLYNRYRLKVRANEEIRKTQDAMNLVQRERENALLAELRQVSRVATLGELAATLTHELNQPLTSILSNAQATKRMVTSGHADSAELGNALGDIVDGAGRAGEIIKRLRKLIRHGELTKESLDLNKVLLDVGPFAQKEAGRHDIDLVMELGADLPSIQGDRIQIQQVYLNLVYNAVNAMSAGSDNTGDLKVRTSLGDNGNVIVAIRDSGPHVSDEILEKMFSPFFSTKEKGLGMGLPICNTVIEAHGGRLWAERNDTTGLTVQFSLPIQT